MKKELKITIALCMLLIFIINGYSQSYKLKSIDLKKNIVKGFKSNNIKLGLHQQFNIPLDYEFKPKTQDKNNIYQDALGFTHEHFVQFYRGIKIENSDIRIHYRNDNVVSVNGEYANEKYIDIIPTLDKNIAISKAIKYSSAKKYSWEIPGFSIGSNKSDSLTKLYPNAELVICKNRFNPNDSAFHLAYKVDVFAIEPLNRSYIYVDAKDGTILKVRSLSRSSVNGQANTAYSGFKTISTYYRSGANPDYILKDNVRNILTKNLRGYSFDPSRATEFSDADNNWGYDSGVATDAHWGLMMTYDYFKEKHLRNSFDNLGGAVTNYVHWGDPYGNPISNAIWVGTDNCILYGDGNGISTIPLTSLDIVAHEFGHGISEKTATLEYEGQSGAIDESLSDIWGACVENYCNGKFPGLDKSIWEMGEDVTSGTVLYLRSMSNPHLKEQPKCIGDIYWEETNGCIPIESNDYCHVHNNSGIMNYWFYLLVNGGSGGNCLNNSYNISPIGIEKAAKIVYQAENSYLTENSQFNEARTSMIQAAIDLYQDNSTEVINTTNAWYAVGVGQSFSCNDVTYLSYDDYYESIEIPGCNFDLTGVIVEPNAKLTLNAVNDVLINGPFEVKFNAQFETK